MTTFKSSLVAAALALGGVSAYAVPTFGAGANSIYFNSLENQYRSTAACLATGNCLAFNSDFDPAGWQRVDPTSVGATAVIQGDVFAGVISVQNITGGSPWSAVLSGANSDMFTGYLAQEVTNVIPVTTDLCYLIGQPVGCGFTTTINQLVLGNPSTDPFGVLTAGGMLRLYSDTGAGATYFDDQTGGTTASIIAKATDGAYWGTLGLGGPGTDVGYAYSLDNPALPGTSSKTENFLGAYLLEAGPAYNGGTLNLINDVNESVVGGVTAGQLCTPAEVANPAIICAEFVGTAEIEKNTYSAAAGVGNSPFIFAGNDPLTLNRVPEPGSLALMGLALAGLGLARRRRSV